MNNNKNQFVFYVIKSSTIKKIIIIDLIAGTGIYWSVNFISSISCIFGTKKMKKMYHS
ncbi:hypothetical protein [Bacillus anthracis]|uniref:hypothetical protein n=1 Tax=Bacillus anthracis TaxID=1392 RepID=UPI000A67A1BC|nr:hypothetical protein [Bacillus anthracis]